MTYGGGGTRGYRQGMQLVRHNMSKSTTSCVFPMFSTALGGGLAVISPLSLRCWISLLGLGNYHRFPSFSRTKMCFSKDNGLVFAGKPYELKRVNALSVQSFWQFCWPRGRGWILTESDFSDPPTSHNRSKRLLRTYRAFPAGPAPPHPTPSEPFPPGFANASALYRGQNHQNREKRVLGSKKLPFQCPRKGRFESKNPHFPCGACREMGIF